ncbi:SDR family oxidoreductase [Saccharibacillus kuerlensis]|uniref:Short-chain dehydrogenase/reductase n=1 Tax=Saccharibacillus kuerlensis TaxID=459527 RepID=A0ABQ2L418_9BACL|nr:SDR family oxidoreductase [Saccharibacillus kuerlensis]GGO01904.1 short-chain dehydrogenase/reductase [Saccharibacillus kuerlensis]
MKTIFITGASTGLGKAAAKNFAEQGWNVVATMRSPEKETELTNYEHVFVTAMDVQQPKTIEYAISQSIERFGQIDVLINNAGYGAVGIFEAATEKQIHNQFDVNVFGLMRVTQALLPHFRSNQQGLIVNISSQGGRITFPLTSLYHATKFAVEGFSESLSYELASQNIQIKLIEPGIVKTSWYNSTDKLQDASLSDYNEFSESFDKGFQEFSQKNAHLQATSEIVAQTIYKAVTDESDQFRYPVGQDAEELLELRKQLNDEEFRAYIRKQVLA